jgi:hypothetical protein
MDIDVFESNELPMVFSALRRVAPTERGEQLCAAVAEIHGAAVTGGEATWGEVAAAVVRPHARERLVQLAIVAAVVDGMPERRRAREVAALAAELGVDEPGVRVVRHLAAGRRLVGRLLMMRRIFGRFAGDAWRADGLAGVRQLIGALWFRGGKDPEMAWRYRQLGLLPEGSLGREMAVHWTANRFLFPGEPGAVPEMMIFHDIGHLLTGFGTDPAGEIQQAAFQAGFLRRDGFSILLFGVMQFHLGIKVTPVSPGFVGMFDVPKVMRALARGAACRDLSEGWRVWADAARPLAEIRAAYGVQ